MTAQHDFLMLACKLDDVDWLDTQPDEQAIFKDIHNYELTTTLVRIPANANNAIPTTPHMFLADKLLSTKDVNRYVFGSRQYDKDQLLLSVRVGQGLQLLFWLACACTCMAVNTCHWVVQCIWLGVCNLQHLVCLACLHLHVVTG